MTRFAVRVLIAVLVAGWPSAAVAQIHREGIIRKYDPAIKPSAYENRGDGVVWEHLIEIPQALWVRVHFNRISSPDNARYRVVIRDRGQRAIARYLSDDFAKADELLSDVLFSDRVFVQVEGTPRTLEFEIDYIVHQVDSTGRLAPLTSVPNWRTVTEASAQLKNSKLPAIARSVSKLYIGDGAVCTGFLIGDGLVLTNHHCLDESKQFRRTKNEPLAKRACGDIELHFDFDQQGAPSQVVRTHCTAVRDFDPTLDFAVLAVDAEPLRLEKAARSSLALADTPKAFIGPLYVIHHPAGLAKKVSFQCQAFQPSSDGPVLDHDCSTVGGSSGAPLFNEAGQVVALHFGGAVPRTMTFEEFERRLMANEVFRNKARPVAALKARLAPLVERPQ